ncbi:unnamed protein product [Mytilus edulis]|uniref:Paraneoplastic antigen Ma-like C-terminal domain-containing protein n=1 Tax=Mytilus edulis TaxID=6550 RepID=A0A8S3S5D9_MYTED|nr:unnamed protein product [Mytilus edulis]
MASGGSSPTKPFSPGLPASPTLKELLQFKMMFDTFETMGLKPKGSNAKELNEWVSNFNAEKLSEKEKKPSKMSLTLPSKETVPKLKTEEKPIQEKSTTVFSQPPKVRCFSGGDNKGDLQYDIWRYDVRMMLMDPSYSKQQKEFAIRRSLTGSAARLVMHQGMEKPIDQIMEVLDSVYGTIDNKEQLLAEFYSARQREDEDVTTWSNRLQDILGKGLGTGIVSHKEMNSMLHAMLWTGLRQELKDISGYKYDTIKDFNQLRVALRQLEKDHQPKKTKPNTAKAATTTIKENTHDYEELKGMVQQLTHQFTELRQQQQQQQEQPQEQLQQQPQQQYYRGNNFRGNRGNNRGRGRGGQWYNNQQGQQQQNYQQGEQQQNFQQGGTYQQNPILCRRCGQEGHIQIG